MAHPIPKELKGEERILSIPIINVHLNRKGLIYNGAVTLLSVILGKLISFWLFLALFIILNLIAYPLAHMKTPKTRFEGGNVSLDKYLLRKFKYNKFKQNIYIRKRGR
ncbi:hypothetical protein [Clostridium magnum]|uniref:TcpE family protein n=1 Tax=Clostridium magnum DSM 2767 TaxID=1121326 RepID=A0A162TJA1_9CLOT|nr:hypothetical protein [Clostridium magnum]KZL92715.1 hypothetical protein CLMAG_25290 [Clostridium magnum DSM 2767]SHI24713.1 hypothetical protein SAMN02745944_03585 [Clostridium magnum DSM 2767]